MGRFAAIVAQVETLLKGHEPADTARRTTPNQEDNSFQNPLPNPSQDMFTMPPGNTDQLNNGDSNMCLDDYDYTVNPPPFSLPSLNTEPDFSWEMVGLGLEEPLPSQEVIDEL